MLKTTLVAMMLILLGVFYPTDGSASTNYSSDQIIVKFKSSATTATVDQVVTKNKGKKLGTDARLGFTKVRAIKGVPIQEQIAAYKKDRNVLYVEPDYVVKTLYTPNDPSYGSQWHIPKMNVPATWDKTMGSSNIVIAVIDTGVDSDHPDLTSKLVAGYNSISNNSNWNDDQGHGTHVAGIAAGATDNGVGTAGVCMNCKIMPVKTMSANGSGYTSDIAEGVRWAADNGAKIINLSLGSTNYSQTMIDAINYAYNKGCLIVTAAGNDNSGAAYYPAAYNNVLAVAATDSNNNRASFSNYGSHIDVAAPGVSILATTFDGGYGYKQGTSMATPNVAGVAGLILSYNPAMTPAQVEQLLKDKASDLGTAGKDDYYGFGLVNALAAINEVADSTVPTAPTSLAATVRTTSISLSWIASTDNVGVTAYEVFRGGTSIGTTTSTGFTSSGLTTNQNYTFTVKAKDAAGNASAASSALTVKPQASTNAYAHTITLDKVNDFNGNTNLSGNETFSTSTNNFFSYVTWDATNIYLGYNGPDFTSTTTDASTKWLLIYVGGTGGTTSGVNYNTQSPGLPFSAKYHIRWKVDGSYFNRQVFNNGSWSDAGTYATSAFERNNSGFVEMRIPRADIGSPSQLQLLSFVINEKPNSEWTWAITPSLAVNADGYDRDFSKFYEFDLSSSVAAASQIYNYGFERTSNTSTSASFSFTAQSGATQVKIQQSTNGGTTWADSSTSAVLSATSTSATVTGLTANTSYKFRLLVTGGNNEGGSAIVNESMFVDVTTPTVPASLTVLEKTTTSVKFSWTASTDNVGVSGYDVYRGATLLGTTTETNYTASGLTADTSYTFTVKAKDAAGNVSAASSALTVSTNPIVTSYVHTITLDGNNDFYNSGNLDKKKNETFTTSTANMFSYLTWDANNIYFGYNSSDISGNITNASQKWIWVYVGGSGGTSTGVNYSGQQPNLPFAAKYHLRFKVDGGYTNRQMWNGTSWQDMGNYSWGTDQARNDGNKFVEFKIPRSHLGMDSGKTLQWVSTIIYEDAGGNGDAMWASMPSNAYANGDGFDRDFTSFYEFDMSSPSAPASQVYNHQFTSTANNANSATFSFIAATGSTDVKIQQSTDGGTTWATSTTAAALHEVSTSATVTGLSAGTAYKFRLQITGGNADGSSAIVNVTPTPDTVAPTVPSGLQASNVSAFGITLTWTVSTDSNTGVKEYHVFRGATLLGKTSDTTFAVSGLNEYAAYSFTVRAEDVAGNLSAASTSLNVTTQDITAPSLPSMFEYSNVTASGFVINWTGAVDSGSGIKEYEIYRNGTLIITIASSSGSYTFSGLGEFSSHNVNIKVRDHAGNASALSSTLTVRTLDATAPTAPSGLTVSNITSSGFTLTWSAATDSGSGVVAYQVFDGATLVDTVTSGTSITMNALSPYSEHAMTVKAVDDSGNISAASSVLTVRTLNNWNDIALTGSSVAENSTLNTTIGSLSAIGADTGQSITYSLVSGTGSSDNSSFTISGNQLKSNASINFELKTTFSIRVKALDANGAVLEKTFTIIVTDVNEAPTDITLSATSLAENAGANVVVGTLSATDQDASPSFTFSLVSGAGDTDNGSFNVSGSSLRASASFDYETKSSYSVRVQVSDGDLTYAKVFTISVTDVNEAPTDIALSATSLAENAGANAVVVTLSATDPDANPSFTFSLVSGTGDTDNASFNVSGNSLRAGASFDYETKSSYSVRVQVSDGALAYAESFAITVTDVNEAPTDITLSGASIVENAGTNAVVGTLSATDSDANPVFTFSLVSGTGDTDNASFNVSGNSLRAGASFDYETKSSYSVRVQVSDGVLTYAEVFTITVTDVNEAPTDIALSATSLAENAGANAVVGTLSATDPDVNPSFTFSLVSGAGDTDNGSFNVSGSSLRAGASFDYETKSSYSVRVQVSDGALTYAEAFAITVTDVNEAPTDISLSTSSLAENAGTNPVVGTLSSTDADAEDTAAFELVSGEGDTDNASFNVSGNSLRAGASFDFETKSSYSVRVQVSDGALTYAEAFTITVTDVDDTAPTVPTDLASSNVTATSATISWSASSDNVGVIGYKVYNGTTLVGTTTVGVTPNATSLALSGLVSGSSNSITVVALDIAGNKSTASTALTVNLLDVVAPSVPSGFATFNVTQSGFTVSWTASTDNRAVRSYNVYRNGTYVATVGTNRYTFTGMTTSTTYNISVLAIDTSNNRSIQSAPFAVTTSTPPDVTAPSIPSGLTTTSVSSNRILLTWTPSTDNIGITGYNVYVNNVYVKTVTAAQTDLTGLTQLTTYSIEVQALDAAKNRSLRSTLLVVTTRDGLAPSVPSGLASGSITRNGFRVSWTAATDNVAVANYNVYRNGAYVATTGPTTTSYTFSNLPFNETHQVRIMAIDASGNKSAQSTALSVATTFVVDPIAPSAPTNVTSSNVSKTGLRVTWTAATDNVAVRNYNLYRNGAYVATVSGTTTGYNFSGLTAGTTYSIVVRAIDAEGNFTNSTAQSVTTLP